MNGLDASFGLQMRLEARKYIMIISHRVITLRGDTQYARLAVYASGVCAMELIGTTALGCSVGRSGAKSVTRTRTSTGHGLHQTML